ncbi:hypothetical protein EIP91_010354 [Steccherinum ochraceum]|uniref:dual-specificity kinase n=1 Tax=Steccherinum ochraceum TaxID=92696 RepID=A0A4R0R2W7_9APHY|nr:hypothetical protein EIP91_010354 [Steccherinum ochraceum]
MSAPPSPRIGPSARDNTRPRKRDRPPALAIADPKAASDGDVYHHSERNVAADSHQQPRLHVSHAEDPPRAAGTTNTDASEPLPRSPSATSSLDPYYFSVRTPPDSPVPPLPTSTSLSSLSLPRTPDIGLTSAGSLDPLTPPRTRPRQYRSPRFSRSEVDVDEQVDEVEEEPEMLEDESVVGEVGKNSEQDAPDSPWTIEAVDGEGDDQEYLEPPQPQAPRTLRSRRSAASESGGEEILYPRQPLPVEIPLPASSTPDLLYSDESPRLDAPLHGEAPVATSPPSAFASPMNRPRKRTSEEFELDNNGVLVSKHMSGSPSTSPRENDKTSVRRHRSLGVGVPSTLTPRDKTKERRRDALSVNVKQHTRQPSAGSSSSSHGETVSSRRVHTSDFSHLPPSPSSNSIQQFLKHSSNGSTASSPLHNPQRDSHNVAHSLLRGTQEGWSDLDDTATAEALRKLDGLTGRSARARSSIGGHSRVGSTSRPTTPQKTASGQWEGVPTSENRRASRRISTHASLSTRDKEKAKEPGTPQHTAVGLGIIEATPEKDQSSNSGEPAQYSSPSPDKSTKKHGSASTRHSFTPKRGSASSTTYASTPTTTPSSRDSASLSAATSNTSVSALSNRQSIGKARRNSAGSDISHSSTDASTYMRDRTAALATAADAAEEPVVPPVPPLPKDISGFKPSPPVQASPATTYLAAPEATTQDSQKPRPDIERHASLEVPVAFPSTPSKHQSFSAQKSVTPTNPPPFVHKTPSKKWSFTGALGKRLAKSPSSSSMTDSSAKSPRTLSFGQQLRKSGSKEQSLGSASKRSSEDWSPINAEGMASELSLASVSSVGSGHRPTPPPSAPLPITSSKTPDRLVPSRAETASSASTNLTASVPPVPNHAPLSPSSSIRRGPSSKRLTPSSIPFFRRSSSQSMQFPPGSSHGAVPSSSSPTGYTHSGQLRTPANLSPTKDSGNVSSTSSSIPGSAHKKSSVLSLGLPSLLKGSSSRRSLHSDRDKNEAKSPKGEGKSSDKEKPKKDEKDRSESRISVLMGRKRGKTLSSAQPKKPEPVALPPMQISALPPATAQRVASLKSTSSSSLSSNQSASKTITVGSRVTSQTVSSMQKQSDSSLRSRNQLPTIAGSPSVGTLTQGSSSSSKEPPSTSLNQSSALNKETPTKIPRISSRSSAANSPTLKGNVNGASRRTSVIAGSGVAPGSRTESPSANELNEFGVLENGQTPKTVVGTSAQRHSAVRASPSATTSRVPRQISGSNSGSTSTTVNGVARKSNRESMSFGGIRKSSTGSVASFTAPTQQQPQDPPVQSHRFSALSPSKGLKLLTPKMSLPAPRASGSSSHSISQVMASPSSSRQSLLTTPSPSPNSVDEEEVLGDEEMMQYIKRQQAKKLATGVSQAELDAMLKFPEPKPPISPSTAQSVLKSSQIQHLSEYECKEILDYPGVYYLGQNSGKNAATLDNTTNNHGYDDERGDYLVVPHDHLAFRYEIIDTLGKGSFGQVLHCRDHCSGESVAIKIIRNKKRFHHQALVEIKILDSLRKWDSDEKHHVIKMTEHFYFRGHLCIAMELLSINLYELIKANGFVGFTTALIRRFTSQMLQSLALMRHHRIVHCDLKPENVLLRHPAKSAIKVIDFGSSCFEHEKIYTYIQSRFYRSPEVILGMNYHMAIDMWSLGCILAELYTGFPIFPGENEQEQLSCIMEVLGVPDKDFINRSSRKRLFFDTTGAPRPVVNSKGRRRRPGTKTLAQVLRCDDELFLDFIAKCLVWDPERRLKPQAALRHSFVTASRRSKITSPTPSSTARSLLTSTTNSFTSSRSKQVLETPKKSLISAPTPLTARSTRVAAGNTVPNTPSSSGMSHTTLGSSSRSYRASQSQSVSYQSSRTMAAK